MKEKITPYLQKLIDGGNAAIAFQFKKRKQKKLKPKFKNPDPLGEDEKYSPVKGLVHKFRNRVLWKLTYDCAAYCRFCTRIRQIGSPEGDLSYEEIDAGAEYIRTHPEIYEVILSGGDGIYRVHYSMYVLDTLMKIDSVKVIRIGTRMPLHSPDSFKTKLFKELLKKMRYIAKRKQLLVLIHINHPEELTKKVMNVIRTIKKTGASILTQTVLVKNLNDNVDILEKLFTTLYQNGIRPYYLYRCDYEEELRPYICSYAEEKKIATELRRRLPGPAYPMYVVDLPEGRGKIPPPLNFWKNTGSSRACFDFDGKKIKI